MQDVNRQLFAGTVWEEMLLSQRYRDGVDELEIRSLLADLGLAGMEERHPLSLSAGQRQRLAVATARVSGSDVIVFDEPTSGLDFLAMKQMGSVIRDCASAAAVVLVATHDRELVSEIGDRQLRLSLCDFCF